VAVLPQPRHLGVSTLIRGQRQAEEWGSEEDRSRRGERERDWGPPRAELTTRRLALVLVGFCAATAAGIWAFGLYWTPERPLLIFLVPALLLGRPRRYLFDFAPFAVLILLYAESRGLAHSLHPHPFYLPQLDLERFIFHGHVPAAELQRWLWSGHPRWYDRVTAELLKIHFVVPSVLAFCLWIRRRALFYRFAATMLVLSFAGALTFAIYPAAPPWAAHDAGMLPNVAQLPPDHATVSSVVGATLGSAVTTSRNNLSLAHVVPRNPYAAIPSLHGGYAFLVFLFVATLVWRRKGKLRWLLIAAGIIYFLVQSFAVVYTGNHYTVDLVIGFAYAAGSLLLVKRAWVRFGLPQ
jgi:membrane-associated phospholipid phosphatase